MSDRMRVSAGPGGARHGGAARFLTERVRPRDSVHTLKRLAQLFAPHRWTVGLIVILVLFSAAVSLLVPWIVGRIIDHVVAPASGGGGLLSALIVALAVVYTLDAGASWLNARLVAGLSQTIVTRLRQSLFSSLAQKPLSLFDRRDRGDLMSRMTNDVDNIATGLAQSGLQIVSALFGITGSLTLMLILSPLLTLAALATVPLVFLLSAMVSRRTRGFFRTQQASLGSLNASMEEALSGFLEVKAFGRVQHVLDDFHRFNASLRSSGTQAQVWAGLVMPLMNVINNLGLAVLALVGGALCLHGWTTVGTVAAFVGYSRQFGRPLNDVANSWNVLQAAFAGAERVFEVLDEPAEAPDGPHAIDLQSPRGHIVFRDVSFGYRPDVAVLRDIRLEVRPGETVALIGATGSGKTTLVQLLLRFYEPTSGVIEIDGRPLDGWTRSSLRRAFGIVLQDAWLFEGTLLDNLRYGRPDATLDDVRRAARAANVAGFIERLPDQYHTVVEAGGTSLSQGQRQLMTIARALLADAPFLILDEATSNIDTRTEFRLQEALIRLMRGRTCFIIAHRLSTIRDADRIVLIDEGQIVESGTHEELVARGQRYARLIQSNTRGLNVIGEPSDR